MFSPGKNSPLMPILDLLKMVKLKQILQSMSVMLVTFILIFLMGEVTVRAFANIAPPLTVRTPKIGMTYRKNMKAEVFATESEKKVFIKTNNEGFRGSTRPVLKDANTVRIAVLGDSQIAAINTNEEETFVALLEEKLNQLHPQKRWEVFNFGVSGASTAQELNLYEEVVKKYQIDLVVCAYLNSNDFSDNSNRLSWNPRIYIDFKPGSEELITAYLSPIKGPSRWLTEHSRLYVWQKDKVSHAINNFVSRGGAGKDRMIRGGALIFVNDPTDVDLVYSWKLNRKLIETFHDRVTSDGGLFVFISIPDKFELLKDEWAQFQSLVLGTSYEGKIDVNYPQEKLESIVKPYGINYLFLKEAFAAHMKDLSPADPAYYLSYQSGRAHLNENGNLLMTNRFYEYLGEKGILKVLIEKR
jgi:hypothetical protein